MSLQDVLKQIVQDGEARNYNGSFSPLLGYPYKRNWRTLHYPLRGYPHIQIRNWSKYMHVAPITLVGEPTYADVHELGFMLGGPYRDLISVFSSTLYCLSGHTKYGLSSPSVGQERGCMMVQSYCAMHGGDVP